ncbi:MAG: hypothetical protein C0503_11490, partial [Gemmatimonas sp.]|nr:hypothetical protein [Gemmatimonas sp.]
MPELPETETIARDLDAALRGAVLEHAQVLRTDVLRAPSSRSHAGPTPDLTPIIGQSIVRVFRRAKAIVLQLSRGHRLVVVPRFTGALLLGPGTLGSSALRAEHASASARPAPVRPYCCLAFELDGGRLLEYVDVRRLGTVSVLTPEQYA